MSHGSSHSRCVQPANSTQTFILNDTNELADRPGWRTWPTFECFLLFGKQYSTTALEGALSAMLMSFSVVYRRGSLTNSTCKRQISKEPTRTGVCLGSSLRFHCSVLIKPIEIISVSCRRM